MRDNRAGSDDHLAFLRRMVRNYTRAVRARELIDAECSLAHLASLRRELDEQTALIVLELHEQGLSWQAIGDGLGMTRHAAYTKYVARARLDPAFPSENSEVGRDERANH